MLNRSFLHGIFCAENLSISHGQIFYCNISKTGQQSKWWLGAEQNSLHCRLHNNSNWSKQQNSLNRVSETDCVKPVCLRSNKESDKFRKFRFEMPGLGNCGQKASIYFLARMNWVFLKSMFYQSDLWTWKIIIRYVTTAKHENSFLQDHQWFDDLLNSHCPLKIARVCRKVLS